VHSTIITEEPFSVEGLPFTPLPLKHGSMDVHGYRIGSFAYCTDCNHLTETAMERLAGVDLLVLDALRYRPHPTHFTLEQAIETARTVGARQTYFTHIAHDLKHTVADAELPSGMHLAYDGLILHATC
jgi:phosphoribosyl 1,2-cyclic phosphate phosphodiesterase